MTKQIKPLKSLIASAIGIAASDPVGRRACVTSDGIVEHLDSQRKHGFQYVHDLRQYWRLHGVDRRHGPQQPVPALG